MLITQMMRGSPLIILHFAVSAAVTSVVGISLVVFAIRLYQREGLSFSR